MSFIIKLFRHLFGAPHFRTEIEGLLWRYSQYLYTAERVKIYVGERYTVVVPERKDHNGEICAGVYRCTRDQLVAFHAAKGVDWPIPERIAAVEFFVKPSGQIGIIFYEVGESLP